jgi:transcriptional regulator with XRE-family HTH domain
MQLSFAEKLQVLRKRSGLNQGAFGAKAFNLSFDSGRTKIKNIELGKQNPTDHEIEQMARALGVPEVILSGETGKGGTGQGDDQFVSCKVLDRFPKLGSYLEMLNKAVALEDEDLITHIGASLADIFQPVETQAQAMKRIK